MLVPYCSECESYNIEYSEKHELYICQDCDNDMDDEQLPLEDTWTEESLNHFHAVIHDNADEYCFNRFILFGMDDEGNITTWDNGLNLQDYMVGIGALIDSYKGKIHEKGLGKR